MFVQKYERVVLLFLSYNKKSSPPPFCFVPVFSHSDHALEDEGNLGLVILLVLFSMVILTTALSLAFVMW